MPESVSEEKFYDSDYIAQIIRDVLRNRFNYLRYLNDFYGDGSFVAYTEPFPEHSALHSFIEFVAGGIIREESYDVDSINELSGITFSETGNLLKEKESGFKPLPIEEAFDFYEVEYTSFEEWLRDKEDEPSFGVTEDDICDYLDALVESGEYENLLEAVVEDVFSILFQDRTLLEVFNDIMANQVSESELDEIDEEYREFFSEPGILKESPVPLWVKEEVNSRDQGQCVNCQSEIPDIFDKDQSDRFCHIVPLTDGGLNDVTNIQILCCDCDPNVNPRQLSLW
jgi:hypothetical protein